MGGDIAGRGSKPLMPEAQKEGIYASLMPRNVIVTRLDQGLTLPPKIYPKTPSNNGEFHDSKEHATKYSTSEAHDHHVLDNLSQENGNNTFADRTNETQQEHTGKVYGPCQHIEPISHLRHKKLTGGPSIFPILGQKQPELYPSSQSPGPSLEPLKPLEPFEPFESLKPSEPLAIIQSVGYQHSIDREAANHRQLPSGHGNIADICPMGGGIAMIGSSEYSQDAMLRTQKPRDRGVDMYGKKCITIIDNSITTKHLASPQTDGLTAGSIGDRGQELTLYSGSEIPDIGPKNNGKGSKVEEDIPEEDVVEEDVVEDAVEDSSGSIPSQAATLCLGSMVGDVSKWELSCAALEDARTKGGKKPTGNVSASEQLQDEKSQDEKLQYEQLQGKIHTSDQDCASLVGEETQPANGVSCGVGSPKAVCVKSRLYSPIYKSQRADASTQVNTTIATTIRNSSTPKHISATHQHKSLSTLYSSQPELLSLRYHIATAPMSSPLAVKLRELFLASIDGEIDLERNPNFEAQLELIHVRMMEDEQFQKGVVAYIVSKMGYSTTRENDTTSSNQSSFLGDNIAASKSPDPKFNIKTCTLEELKEEYNALKADAKKVQRRLTQAANRCDSLKDDIKELKGQRDRYKTCASSVPKSRERVDNLSHKWMCSPCGLMNDSWADLTEWAPGRVPKYAKPARGAAGVPSEYKYEWIRTSHCRNCGRHRYPGQPELNAETPSKRRLADVTEDDNVTFDEDQFKRHCRNLQSEINPQGRAFTTTQCVDLTAAAPSVQLSQVPLATNPNMANIQQGQNNEHSFPAQYLPNINFNGTVANQQFLPDFNGTSADQQWFPNFNGTSVDQQWFRTGNGSLAGQQFLAIGNDIITSQQSPPIENVAIADQQCSSTSSGTITDEQFSLTSSGTITVQQCPPSLNGTNAGQQYLPSPNGPTAHQLYVPNVIGMFTDQFGGEGDLFADFDFDALPNDNQDPFPIENFLGGGVHSTNMSVVAGAASGTSYASSLDQTDVSFKSARPSTVGSSYQTPIEIDDNILPISQANLAVIHNSRNEKSYQPATKTPSKSTKENAPAIPAVKYDMRGNQIGPATLPTVRYRKPMAPRTAKVGSLTFPASAAAQAAAPQTTQHPNGG